MPDKKIGIVGATGYTGSELVKILENHHDASLKIVTSRSYAGYKFSDIHPQFKDIVDIEIEETKNIDKYKLDLVFLALPHKVSMEFIKEKGIKNFKIVDLSGDFRFKNVGTYEKWYNTKHSCPKMLKSATYGLPELFRRNIRRSRLVANPGCYPTSAILPLAPLLKNGIIKSTDIIIDSKSGVTGAGAKVKESTHFPSVYGNFQAYAIHNHRHRPEIETALQDYSGKKVKTLFTPHLLPVDRGILTTTYSKPIKPVDNDLLLNIFSSFYKKELFVRIVDEPPAIKNVRGSNYCDIFVSYDQRANRIISISVIDNLIKGAAGQAVQNMNIMLNLLERTGLKAIPLNP
jgi:N-acetyl-gamma-glutamyl-phosphate reductase